MTAGNFSNTLLYLTPRALPGAMSTRQNHHSAVGDDARHGSGWPLLDLTCLRPAPPPFYESNWEKIEVYDRGIFESRDYGKKAI